MHNGHELAQKAKACVNAPPPPQRAALSGWLRLRNIPVSQAARDMGLSKNTLAMALLPVTHRNYRPASVVTRERVEHFTGGEIGLSDWPRSEGLVAEGGANVTQA